MSRLGLMGELNRLMEYLHRSLHQCTLTTTHIGQPDTNVVRHEAKHGMTGPDVMDRSIFR